MSKIKEKFDKKSFARRVTLYTIDAIICAIGGILAGAIIYSGYGFYPFNRIETMVYASLTGVLIQLVAMLFFGGYKYILRYSDVHYNARLCIIFSVTCLVQLVICGAVFDWMSGPIFAFIQTAIAFIGVLISRFVYQYLIARVGIKKKETAGAQRVMIIGAGWTGKRVLEDLSRATKKYYPVCFIDDDKQKQHMVMENVPIVGGTDSIERNIYKFGVNKIIFAIPSAPLDVKKEIISRCVATGREVNMLPNMEELVATTDMTTALRKVKIEDLLERPEVKFSSTQLLEFIQDKVCLVTGGGGSIGSELCRQIMKYNPKKLIVLDVYENCAFDIAQELKDLYDFKAQVEILSVTDEPAMDKLFSEEHVDIVFHAAAHKHVPLMEHNPAEAIKNNVVGTYITAKIAAKYKVKKFIMVSTDKAVNPTNVMGATKRFCEKIVNYFNAKQNDTVYACVRFGNVLGSHGSVIHIFNRQIENGGPVKVTHPDIIRYFMTIPEAASLILQAGVFAGGGEVFVLDMGEPVKIVNLAENMIRLAGYQPYRDIDIEFTGLRPGEKLYEELLMKGEGLNKTENEKIFIGDQSFVVSENVQECYEELIEAASTNDKQTVVSTLSKAVETFHPDERFYNVGEVQPEDNKKAKPHNKKKKPVKTFDVPKETINEINEEIKMSKGNVNLEVNTNKVIKVSKLQKVHKKKPQEKKETQNKNPNKEMDKDKK